MAIINCKECGKEMSDTVKKCPHCGFSNKKLKQEKINNGKIFIKQHIKVVYIIIIILVVGVISFTIHNKKIEKNRIQAEILANTLTEDEKMVAKVVNKLKSSLKNPESLQVFEITYHKSNDNSATVIIDSAGQNGFGGTNRNRHMYILGKDGSNIMYMGSDDKADNTITMYTSSDDRLEIAAAKVIRDNWTKRENFIVADTNKIMKNLNQGM